MILQLLFLVVGSVAAFHIPFSPTPRTTQSTNRRFPTSPSQGRIQESSPRRSRSWIQAEATSSSSVTDISSLEASVDSLKRTLEREYASFFSPMERDYYADAVTFDDPMTSLEGIDAYQRNVDMLSGKNIMGKILFRDAGIVLHKVTGGTVTNDNNNKITIDNLITRWTLRFTFQALPWQPTARFSGISVYEVAPGGPKGVQVTKQTDYWDSINLVPNQNVDGKLAEKDQYQSVPTSQALSDFVNQLKPSSNFAAPSAGNELPYQLLRRGLDYEVRRYPSFVAVQTPYERRDLGFSTLGAFCTGGLNPLAPAVMTILSDSDKPANPQKSMLWPLAYAPPGSPSPPATVVEAAQAKQATNAEFQDCDIVVLPERVVAVGRFADASVEPVVRAAHRALRVACQRDGLTVEEEDESCLSFAQYDAIFSMGERRGEVWIELKEGQHPWTT